MKYKIALFFCIFFACCTFYCTQSYASTLQQILNNNTYKNVFYLRQYWNDDINQGTTYYIIAEYTNSPSGFHATNNNSVNPISVNLNNGYNFDYYRFKSDPLQDFNLNDMGAFSTNSIKCYLMIGLSRISNFVNDTAGGAYGSYDDYENALNPPTPTPPPSWYKEMWDNLSEQLGNPEFWFGEWFVNIIDNVFGGNENEPTGGPSQHSNSTHVNINNPSPTPAPSPIPYTTVVIPKTDPITGDTIYETNYYYTNPSGTPIITSQPPTQPPSQNGTGGGNGDYNPTDPYAIPQISWLTNATISSGSGGPLDGIGSIGQGMDSIDEIGSEYNDGMSAVQDATGTLPTSWLLLIGIAAAIPLLAGIISRFLGG